MAHDPAVGGADGVGKFFAEMTPHIVAVFVDFPFVPDFDFSLLKPADVVAHNLINPEHLEDGGFPGDELRGENRELF